MDRHNDELVEENVVDDNANTNEGSNFSMNKDVSETSIVQNKDNTEIHSVEVLKFRYSKYFKSVGKDLILQFQYCACSYFRNVETIITKEMNRVRFEFDTQTIIEYIKIIRTELIIKNMKTIVELGNCGVVYMLKNNQNDDLKWLYNYLICVSGGVKVMFDGMRPYFREVGRSVVLEQRRNYNVNACIQSLLDLKGKFDNLMVNLFDNNPLFDKTVGEEFGYFLKFNPFIPKYLSIFIDEKLRKGQYTYIKNNPEADIDKVIFMIKYLKKKIKFEHFYQMHLCNRLLTCKFVSLGNEDKMLSKMSYAYANGFGNSLFISKIKVMLIDNFISSKIIMMNYEKSYNVKKCIVGISEPFDIGVKVITPVNWPIDLKSIHKIPSFGLSAFNEFKTIYKESTQENSKKKLMILPQFGTVELNAMFYGKPCNGKQSVGELSKINNKQNERMIKLVVSTYQMCVLDLFNVHNTLTYEDIQRETQIPKDSLIKALQDMMEPGDFLQYLNVSFKSNLLVKVPTGQEINSTDKFFVNECFECL